MIRIAYDWSLSEKSRAWAKYSMLSPNMIKASQLVEIIAVTTPAPPQERRSGGLGVSASLRHGGPWMLELGSTQPDKSMITH